MNESDHNCVLLIVYYQTGDLYRVTGGLKQLKFNSSYIRPRCMRGGGHNFSARIELEMGVD